MGQTIWMRMFNNLKYRDAIYFKLWDRFFTSLIVLGPESKGSISFTIKGNLLLYCRKFSAFVVAVISWHILITRSISHKNVTCGRNSEL